MDTLVSNLRRHPYSAPGLKDIDDVVCEVFGVKRGRLRERTRKREIADARAVAMWWKRRNFRTSYGKVGVPYGLNHATAIHNVKKVDYLCEFDQDMRRKVERVVEIAAPLAIPRKDKMVTLKERDFKRMLFREYLEGERATPYYIAWDDLCGIGKYRRIRRFLERFTNYDF